MHAPDSLATLASKYSTLERSRSYIQWTVTRALASGPVQAWHDYQQRFPRDPHLSTVKAIADVGVTSDSGFAAPLVERPLSAALIESINRRTIIGSLAGAVVRVPPLVQVPVVTTPPVAAWTAEHTAIPAADMGLTTTTLQARKLATILAFSTELLRSADAGKRGSP